MTSIVISNNITEISQHTFSYNQLTTVTISFTVTEMFLSFIGNELTSVIIERNCGVSEFYDYGDWQEQGLFGWTDGYGDDNIAWQP